MRVLTWPKFHSLLVPCIVSCCVAFGQAEIDLGPKLGAMCKGPAKTDPIVGYSDFYGHPNASDAIWHDETWAFSSHGPISKMALYKAWFYDGSWHNPGELKGLQTWYGAGHFTDGAKLLFGARKPHVPTSCTIRPGEVIVRVELQWDDIMRWANFTTNRGRFCAWGFRDAPGVTTATIVPPSITTYLAAFRGYEGKPLPKQLGGYKKRYIIQLGFAWAEIDCGQNRGNNLPSADPDTSAPTAQIPPLDKHIVRPGAPVAPPSSMIQESAMRLGPKRKLSQQTRC